MPTIDDGLPMAPKWWLLAFVLACTIVWAWSVIAAYRRADDRTRRAIFRRVGVSCIFVAAGAAYGGLAAGLLFGLVVAFVLEWRAA